jgi:hypothetical protein
MLPACRLAAAEFTRIQGHQPERLAMPEYPQIFRVRQSFERPRVENIPAEVQAQLATLRLSQRVRPDQSVAITAGSRGIANIRHVIKAIVDHFKAMDARPFIVPAMGSHGGGTAAGQTEILAGYGITEEFCGCPIRASMETVIVCQAAEGFPVHFDKHACGADHVVVCGRVKPHTNFVGDIESGLMKMMLIGLGKHNGAKIYHRAILNYSFGQIVRSVAREVLSRCRILCGVAIVENAYDETAKIAAVPAEEFEARERQLLVLARQWLPRLPFREADILLIDQIGKNISGTGMDTNVIGRKYNDHLAAPDEWPKIKRVIVRGLTEATHGNACGIGMSEFCLSRVAEQMNPEITWINVLTGGHPTAGMTPIHFPTDRQVLDVALPSIGLTEPPDAKLMWIRDTLTVEEVECASAFYNEARERSDLEVIVPPRPLPLGRDGMLPEVSVAGAHQTAHS